ncbi:P-loop containing nucleoside triphosphate hydrolase protein [Fusarium tricinctum]|uniref:P-loop containing nucleoside triphosphate hydrolase protein n=1 Tax=Fusarium tricinctum TaxID=61284 RepID=A0A8K0RWG4_9HYPO|nr:P-loop containing nucleoside triphosphate hydrolase protein [Fusarium tricinctum]
MNIEAKTFYESRNMFDDDKFTWVEHAPTLLPEASRHRFDSAAIQIYKKCADKKTINNVSMYETSFIKIQSPIILDKLRDVMKNMDVYFDERSVDINKPFQPLYFAWDQIKLLYQGSADDVDTEFHDHIGVLYDFMDTEMKGTHDRILSLHREGRITFDLVWTLFPKGAFVFSFRNGYRQAMRVLSDNEPWNIRCEYVQFNGYEYGLSERYFSVRHFFDTKPITSLEIYPWKYVHDSSLKQALIDRGRDVLDYQSKHYLQYVGLALDPENASKVSITKFNIKGRIMVDAYLFARSHEGLRKDIRSFRNKDRTAVPSSNSLTKSHEDKSAQDRTGATAESHAYHIRARPDDDQIRANRKDVETNDDYLLCMSPLLDGFSFGDKKWFHFLVECIKPVAFQHKAFDHLVMPARQKELLLAFAEDQDEKVRELDDVVTAGQGLLVLLSGPPGTGKTLTAEAISERVKRPLYHVDTHEIGSVVETLSIRLRQIMNMAAEWDAISLSEADVFLQKRSMDHSKRNESIAVFLRELEYYRGTMFLTTNLIDAIDEAMESRVHVHVRFQRLPPVSRQTIWTNFLAEMPVYGSTVSEAEIKELAAWTLNGRQIKNVIHMAIKWCAQNKLSLDFVSVEHIIRLTCPGATKSEPLSEVNGGEQRLAKRVSGME